MCCSSATVTSSGQRRASCRSNHLPLTAFWRRARSQDRKRVGVRNRGSIMGTGWEAESAGCWTVRTLAPTIDGGGTKTLDFPVP